MTQSFFAAFIVLACAAPLSAGLAFQNFVDSGRYARALVTLGGMVALLMLIALR